MPARPNILFLMADQLRGDSVGADPQCPTDSNGAPIVHTPNLDSLVDDGALFSRAYSPTPSCVPARRCLWTGQTPATNGCTNWTTAEWDFEHTLAGELTSAGYQTRMVGHLHSMPPRNHVGFEHIVHDKLDYADWLEDQPAGEDDVSAHGIGNNSWDARPSHLPERLERTRWTTDRALEFLEKRDPTRPFFLNVSYTDPHPSLTPPRAYWDMYVDRDLPEPYSGAWVEDYFGGEGPEHPATWNWRADVPASVGHRARAGYYGLITFVDQQIHRLLDHLLRAGELDDTLVLFTSDHGEMLGDHGLWRKTYAFEGSARVPMLMRFPERMDYETNQRVSQPVGLEDVMPTLLGAVGVDVPATVEGSSLLPLLEDDDGAWRRYYHGEHGPIYHEENAMQYLVGERTKYIWNPVTGSELLFDLEDDPGETRDVSDDAAYREAVTDCRSALVDRLRDREEGFTEDDSLSPTNLELW